VCHQLIPTLDKKCNGSTEVTKFRSSIGIRSFQQIDLMF